MGVISPKRFWAAQAPRQTIYVGEITFNWMSRKPRQFLDSSGVGVLFPGGRHFRVLRINTSLSRSNPHDFRMFVRSVPDFPQNGTPWRFSSLPGASPQITILASGLPQ